MITIYYKHIYITIYYNTIINFILELLSRIFEFFKKYFFHQNVVVLNLFIFLISFYIIDILNITDYVLSQFKNTPNAEKLFNNTVTNKCKNVARNYKTE